MEITSAWPWNAHGTIERDVVDHKIRDYMAYFIAISGYISHVCQPSFGCSRFQPKATKTPTVSSFCSAFSVDKHLCSYYVPFAKFATTLFSARAHLGGHVTRDCNF